MSVDFTNTANPSIPDDRVMAIEERASGNQVAAFFQDQYASDMSTPGGRDQIREALSITADDTNDADTLAGFPDVDFDNLPDQENLLAQKDNNLEDAIAGLDYEGMSNVSLSQSPIFQAVKSNAEIADARLLDTIEVDRELEASRQTT
jgi:hypothetical protein